MKAFINENPLKSIFKLSSKGKITEEINSMNKINLFFNYIKDEKIPSKIRSQIIEELIGKLKINRYLCEYFSLYENQSIYIFLIQLYTNKSTSSDLKSSIINFINELRINIDITKDIYDYVFQKISAIYREGESNSKDILNDYLTLLNTFVEDTINHLKPRNYFSCSGEGFFEVDLSKLKLKMGCSLTFIINFRIGISTVSQENPDKATISNLISINFSNGYNIDFDLQYPIFLIVKEIQDKFIKTLPHDESINLIINVVKDDKNNISVFCYANGENRLIMFSLNKHQITDNETISTIRFFNNFYGEVSSITFLAQKDYGYPGVNASEFLLEFRHYKEGLWKKKKIENFIKLLNEFDSIGIEKAKSKTVFSRKKTLKIEKKFDKIEKETNGKLIENLIFIFTPLNYSDNNKNIIENVLGFLNMRFTGNIRPHKYHCFQKKMGNMGLIDNLLPIAEMYLIRPELLNENNFEIFLKIIRNSLNNRKNNMEVFSDFSFFQILSLFIEKYPKNVFTEKILDTFADIGKCMFGNDVEILTSIYFEHILLNEKILSKYSEDLQIKFWNYILLFCQSDSSQIELFINLNRICLILRFYDRNKYTEMCCQKHLSMIKDGFTGNKIVMNPPMDKKLKSIENIMNVIINSQEPEKAFTLFKLLTLDLSPCLTEFILNIFINAFKKKTEDNKWKDNFIKVLVNNKFETIIANTIVHSLPEIRLSLLSLIFEINFRLSKTSQIINFKNLEKTIKHLLLPKDNFYSEEIITNNNLTSSLKAPIQTNKNNCQKKEPEKKDNHDQNKSKVVNPNSHQMLKPTKKEDNKKNEKTTTNTKTTKKEEPKKQQASGNSKIASMISQLEGMGNKFPGMGPRPQLHSNKTKDNLSKSVLVPYTTPNPSAEKGKTSNKNSSKEINTNSNSNTTNTSINNSSSKKLNDLYYDLNFKKSNGEVIIFKESIYIYYVEKVYKLLLLWSLNLPPSFDFEKVNFKSSKIESVNALELLVTFALEVNDINYYLKCLGKIESLSSFPQNAYRLVSNDKIISSLLDIAFKYYRTDDKTKEKCFELIKSILLNCYMDSIIYLQDTHAIYPCDKIEIMFLWGDKIVFNEKSRRYKDIFFEFLSEFLFEYLTAFKIKIEPLMNFNLSKPNFTSNPGTNFFLKNYLILITHLFRYSFNYKHDQIIRTEGLTFISLTQRVNAYLVSYITGMTIDPIKGNRISEQWSDYPFFDDIYKRIGLLWNKIKNYNNKKKKNKYVKYEEILEKVILNKDNKNLYQKELELLCYQEVLGEKEQIIPLIKIIPIGLMCITHSCEKEPDFLYWLKELKKFTRFLIIASSNLIRTNQLEIYNEYQEKCINSLISCICFLKDLLENSTKCQDKIEKTLESIFLFCALIVKYQYNYFNKHKGLKKIKIPGKPSRNDLLQSAVFIIFSELIKDQTGAPLLSLKELESLTNTNYTQLMQLLNSEEWNKGFFENKILRDKISNNFFIMNNYKKIVDNRIKLIKLLLKDENDEKYKNDILTLLPEYEKELLKYSNNSLEKNKKIKNIYKRLKKRSFTWYGYWSDRRLFFHDTDKLKLKLMNHLTKTLMKPVLVPILDMTYYLPEFSGFDPSNLFNPNKIESSNSSNFKLIMDIDRILKSSEQSNIKEIKKNLIEKNEENFLRIIYTKSNPELAESLNKIANSLDFGKEEEFAFIEKDKNSKDKSVAKYFLSCLVKTSHHIKGVCFIDDTNLNFKVFLNQRTGNAMSGIEIGFTTQDDDYDQDRQTCFGSYFVCHPKDRDLYKISIKYSNIKWIFRRRYYYKNSALEIFTTTNKTFYFNFKYEAHREDVIKAIINKLKDPSKIIDDLKDPKDIFDNVIGYENTAVTDSKKGKKIKLSKKIELWKEWKITNYELLMWLNIYGNRSFNDLSQYPVFPWVLSNYQDPLKNDQLNDEQEYNLRDMSIPMGMMDFDEKSEQRKELFKLNYETLKENADEGMKPYFFGSNYSNPYYVCYYLMRIFPFTHIAIELQGSKFDQPDRLFLSVENSFFNSTTQKTDVRELIPEFFYLPEIFLNINDLNMGQLENGEKVNDISTPCHNNPYEFVQTLKTVLESNEVSNTIQNWIDLIFGSKARGKEAENANNLFTEASYQETIDITKAENKESNLRMVEFGLIPTQIMNKDCSKRDKKEDLLKGKEITDSEAVLINYDCKPIKDQTIFGENKEDIVVLKAGEFSQDKITVVLSNNNIIEKKISYSMFERKFTDEITNSTPLLHSINKMGEFYSNESNQKAIQFFNRGKILIMGGFYDGKIVINFIEEKKSIEIIPFNDDCPILSVCLDQNEEYLFIGNSQGNVAVYKIEPNIQNWKIIKIITSQKKAISHLYSNSDLNLWLSTSIDGYINLYTLPLCKLARTIKIASEKCSYAFLSSSPLPSIVAISDDTNSEIVVYSLNGKLISKHQLYYELNNPIIIKDMNSNDYLSYIGKETISIHRLTSLETIVNIDISPGMQICTIFTSEDKKTLYCINKNGSQVYVIKDEIKKNLRNPSSAVA